jgi:hypothetical protein
MSDNPDLVLQRFRAAATRFIETVDSARHLELDSFLAAMNQCLVELYGSALSLPIVVSETTGTENTAFPTESSEQLRRFLREKIGAVDDYWQIFDVTAKGGPVQGSLANDISEIYFDLKRNLRFEDQGLRWSDLLWELRFDFTSHWGRHVLAALTAIYCRHID